MPSIEAAKRMNAAKFGNAETVGQAYKNISDNVMEWTWASNIQSRRCYIYDYAHDDQPDKYYGMTYENTSKYPVDIKFIVTKYGTVDKDQVEYHIQFRPSQKVQFDESDELYYFETDYRQKYGNSTFIGLYCDIPDDNGTYYKWLICGKEIGNQFIKYSVLPVTYRFMWIEREDSQAIKRRMWGVLRQQSSSSSGLSDNSTFTLEDNKNKIWLPLNRITERIWFTNDQNQNLRTIVSAPVENPAVWVVSKVENVQPFGIQKIVCEQTAFNPNTDYIEKDENGNIVGMWADYYFNNIKPADPILPTENAVCKITASTNTLKVGGSYRLLTATFLNSSGGDITGEYLDKMNISCWKCFVGEQDFTNSKLVIWSEQENKNTIKIKIANNRDYLGTIAKIKCIVGDISGELEMEITS